MQSAFIFILLIILFLILLRKGKERSLYLMIGIFFLNDTVRINPFNSYTLLCIAFFCSLLLHKELKTEWKRFPFKKIMYVLFVIHILVVLFDPRVSAPLTFLSRICNNFVSRFLALFIGYASISTLAVWYKSSKQLALIFCVMGCYGFITFILQGNPYDDALHIAFGNDVGIWSEVQSRGYRVLSTLNNPIVYGFVMFIATTYLYLQRDNFSKNVYFCLSLLVFLNVFLANSRTGIVAGVFLLVVYALVEYKLSFRLLGYAFSVILICCILYQFVPFVQDTADSVLDIFLTGGTKTEGSNVELKEKQMETSLLYFYLHPYFGSGFNYFREVIVLKDAAASEALAGLEGYGYKLLVEEGIFMIIAVSWLFLSILWYFLKRLSVKQYSSMGVAWTLSFLFFIISTGTYGGVFTICMIFIGMLLKYVQIKGQVNKRKNRQTGKMLCIK